MTMKTHPNGTKGMIDDILMEVEFTRHLIGKQALDKRVMKAMESVPREQFVPRGMRSASFDNRALSIGHGQTISQPYMVALMTDLLNPKSNHVVLEVGTGSGYQAAVLSQVVKHVYSLEIVDTLVLEAKNRLRQLHYDNVEVQYGDGYYGLAEHAPYDGIIVTAAAPFFPPPLIEQLKPGGRLVIPVGLPYLTQELFVVEKDSNGNTKNWDVLSVAFVPLTGDHDSPSPADSQE